MILIHKTAATAKGQERVSHCCSRVVCRGALGRGADCLPGTSGAKSDGTEDSLYHGFNHAVGARRSMSEARLPRKLAAVLYADVAGYSRLTGEDEEGTHRRLSAHLDILAQSIKSHNGAVVHYAGDAVLAEFQTVTEAMACAVDVQREFRTKNAHLPDERKVQFRIGVNLGEVIVDRDDIYGDGVNVAARLESLAEPGGICVSEAVRGAVGTKLAIAFDDMGRQRVKNIAQPVQAYRVVLDHARRSRGRGSRRAWMLLGATAAVVAVVAGVLGWRAPWAPREEPASVERMAYPLPDKPSIAVLCPTSRRSPCCRSPT